VNKNAFAMSDTSPTADVLEPGDGKSAEELFQMLYGELRRLAAHKMAGESADHTLQPTALVHEAWLRLGADQQPAWRNRAHYFAAAAEAMRRILIEKARRRKVLEKGGFVDREEFAEDSIVMTAPPDEMLALHENLNRLAEEDSVAADLVKLRYFVGMSMPEAAEVLGMPLRNAERIWTFARSWLREAMER